MIIKCFVLFIMNIFVFLMTTLNYYAMAIDDSLANYFEQRKKIINEEQSMSFGANIVLDENEKRANEILMMEKRKELEGAFRNPKSFLPSKNFLQVSNEISKSKVFQIIRKMPKGGVLHAHIAAITSRDFILGNITQRPNLYVCRKPDGLKLRFLNKITLKYHNYCQWEPLAEARKKDKYIDNEIAEALTMFTDNPYRVAKSIDDAWKKFLSIFCFIKSLVTYRPVYEDFLYHIMEELYEDNVQFIEVRTAFSMLYELNGYQYNHLQVAKIYNKVVERFVKNHPDFMGVKWIYSPQRNVPEKKFTEYIENFRILKETYPNLVVGFDLVGQEDKGRPLKDFIEELLILAGVNTKFFFHSGETNWNGLETDENLIDAILLNTKRIGHGYALLKHPKLMELVKEKDIAIEISPISNQVLKLVKDLRNHPANYFFATNLPIVISNDDPSFWEARALSYDFYEAFIGMMSSRTDIKALKQLAINSIVYSSMNKSEIQNLMSVWNKRWNNFIKDIVDGV